MSGLGLKLGLRRFRQGSKLNYLSFDVDENTTPVGQIVEEGATSFTITSGADDFTIDNLGNIAFIAAPDYETQNLYTLRVKSNKGKRYYITVNINDVASTFALNTDTTLLLNTAI